MSIGLHIVDTRINFHFFTQTSKINIFKPKLGFSNLFSRTFLLQIACGVFVRAANPKLIKFGPNYLFASFPLLPIQRNTKFQREFTFLRLNLLTNSTVAKPAPNTRRWFNILNTTPNLLQLVLRSKILLSFQNKSLVIDWTSLSTFEKLKPGLGAAPPASSQSTLSQTKRFSSMVLMFNVNSLTLAT